MSTGSTKTHQGIASAGGAGGDVNIHDGIGNPLTSTVVGADQALDVNIVAGAGAGGTSIVDDTAFTPTVTAVTPIGGFADEVAPDSVNEGDAGAVRMSLNRNLNVRIRDDAGNERGLNINAAGEIAINDGGNSLTVDDGGVPISVDDNGGSLTVDDGGVALSVDDAGGSLTVDNAALSVVGGGAEATALRVTVANDSTGLLSVDDNGGSLTVDNPTISVVGGGAEATAQRVTIANDSTGLVSVDDNGGSLSVDDDGGSLTVDNAALSVTGGGVEATALRVTVANDSTGVLSVDDNAGSLTVDNPILSVVGGGTEAAAQRVTIANDSTGLVSVDDGGGTLSIDGTLTGITNDVSIDDGGNSITVDNAALSVVGGGAEATALRVTIANDSTGVLTVDDGGGTLSVDGTVTAANTAGDVADDAADSGNPVKVGGVAVETDGTDPGEVAEGDRAEFPTDLNRRPLVNIGHPNTQQPSNNNYAVAQTNQQQIAAPGGGLHIYITGFILNTETAMNIKIVDDTAGVPADILGPYYFTDNGGTQVMGGAGWLYRVDANTNVGITSSAAGNHTVTIFYYIAP